MKLLSTLRVCSMRFAPPPYGSVYVGEAKMMASTDMFGYIYLTIRKMTAPKIIRVSSDCDSLANLDLQSGMRSIPATPASPLQLCRFRPQELQSNTPRYGVFLRNYTLTPSCRVPLPMCRLNMPWHRVLQSTPWHCSLLPTLLGRYQRQLGSLLSS